MLPLAPLAGAAEFVVTTTADTIANDGLTSLSEAVRMANQEPGPDSITFSDGAGGSVNFHDAVPETITLVLGEIDVCGPVTITGPGAGKLSISGGDASRIFDIAEDETIITGLTFRNGKGDGGGAIFKDGGTLSMIGCVVMDSDAGIDSGGGIYAEAAEVELIDTTVSGNTAAENGGGILAVNSTLSLVRSTISGNTATSTDGGGIYAAATKVSLRDCVVTENTAREQGGGILGTGGTLTLTHSSVENNVASFVGGGGIHTNATTVSLSDSTVGGNSASSERGGGIVATAGTLSLVRCNIGNNAGGGLALADTTASLTDCSIKENTEGSGIYVFRSSVNLIGSNVEMNQTPANGGGINASFGADLKITDSVIRNNGGGDDGGGIFASGSTVAITRSTISENRALGESGLAGLGGGIRFDSGSGQLTLTDSTVSGNFGIDGGAGIHSSGDSRVILTQCTLSGNTATSPESTGGGIYADSGSLAVIQSTLNGNRANSGGSLYTESVDLILANCILADSGGLDVDLDGTSLTLNGKNLVQQGIIRAIHGGTGEIILDPVHLMTSDPLLAPLESNGGATMTHSLLAGSPAIDAGDNALADALPTDQRGSGFDRIVKDKAASTSILVDIGAYESQKVFDFKVNPNGTLLLLFGTPGSSYAIEYSDDLTAWTVIHGPSTAPPDGRIMFLDSSAPRPGRRFYRTVELP